ncbi:CpsB/CapC family capsule biosynthesis tyrosine phosphatase [Marvinbryantia formatexigens]|uniref:CpsB/CapC family capsule biosynthesis tyrosine phosphatase n=1 Tax=Marvinbryantia formatexigens TaxID=168384 RepID=UPI001A9A659F|nr:CpsB/CapC family capsule biosynthesis tyrosine phosphatase [Marvinbryantia formatexigens]
MDIHSHILPGVDDGSPNMEVSMKMLSMAYDEGIRHLFLTPHYVRGENQYRPEDLDQLFAKLQAKAGESFRELHLYLGNEVYYTPGVAEDIRKGKIHTMCGTRYLLVEFDTSASYREIYRAVRELRQMRLFPVIAHVERYQSLKGKPELFLELKELDACFQLNAGGVLGNSLHPHTRWCRKLVENGMITFLGTDAHDMQYRTPAIRKAATWMTGHISGEYQSSLFRENAGALIRNQYI